MSAQNDSFICDAEHAYVMKHDYEPSRNEELRRTSMARAIEYLEGLRTVATLLERFGSILHHNVDKALLCGGAASGVGSWRR